MKKPIKSITCEEYELRVQALELEGLTRSDAQGCVDAELMSEKIEVRSE